MFRKQSDSKSLPERELASPHPQFETLEKRLQSVEAIICRLLAEPTGSSDPFALLRERALHHPDKIPTGSEKPLATSPYLNADEAAAYLGITVSSLYGIVERRHLTPLRGPRRRYRFTKELLDEYLRRRKDRR